MAKNKKPKKTISLNFLYWLIPLVLVLGLMTYGIILYNAVSNISIKETEINDIRDFSSSGFIVEAFVEIENPSIIDLKAKKVKYTLELGDKKTEKTLNDIFIKAKSTKRIKIEQEVHWGFTYDVVKDTLLGQDSNLYLNGEIIIMESPLIIKVPFEAEFDMKDELTDYVSREAKKGVKNVVNKAVDGAKDLINDIFG